VVDVGHMSKRAIFTDPEVDPMKISNFFEIFFSSKMFKNDVLSTRKLSGNIRNDIWHPSSTVQGYKLALIGFPPVCSLTCCERHQNIHFFVGPKYALKLQNVNFI